MALEIEALDTTPKKVIEPVAPSEEKAEVVERETEKKEDVIYESRRVVADAEDVTMPASPQEQFPIEPEPLPDQPCPPAGEDPPEDAAPAAVEIQTLPS